MSNPVVPRVFCIPATGAPIVAVVARVLQLHDLRGVKLSEMQNARLFLPDALGKRLIDDDSIFESDIEKCPDHPFTRKQMAALLHRALGR